MVYAEPIGMLTWNHINGDITPISFRIKRKDKSIASVKIDRLINCKKGKVLWK